MKKKRNFSHSNSLCRTRFKVKSSTCFARTERREIEGKRKKVKKKIRKEKRPTLSLLPYPPPPLGSNFPSTPIPSLRRTHTRIYMRVWASPSRMCCARVRNIMNAHFISTKRHVSMVHSINSNSPPFDGGGRLLGLSLLSRRRRWLRTEHSFASFAFTHKT